MILFELNPYLTYYSPNTTNTIAGTVKSAYGIGLVRTVNIYMENQAYPMMSVLSSLPDGIFTATVSGSPSTKYAVTVKATATYENDLTYTHVSAS